MNKVFLIGNLTRDPELSSTQNGIKFCRFTLAVSRNYAAKDGKREADFIQVVVWRNQADNCARYLKKGSRAAVCGSIQTRKYEQDGVVRYTSEVAADEVQFLSTKSESDRDGGEFDDLKPIDDDLPF